MSKIYKSSIAALIGLGSLSLVSAQDVQINEILASNNSGLVDPDFNQTSDWIELKNTTSSTIDISGYYLSDSETSPLKWEIPTGTTISAGGYIIFYADNEDTGKHTNFKLSSAGEGLSLFDSSKKKVDQVTFPVQFSDQSYGRKSDGAWVYMPNVTPNTANNTSVVYSDVNPMPALSPAPGLKSGAVSVTISIPSGTTVHYTTDGSNPTKSSPVYSSPISLSSTTVIKAIAVKDGSVSSMLAQGTYLYGADHTMDVVSLTSENYDLTGSEGGYLSIDGRVRIDFIEKSGALGFSQYADFAASGNSSEGLPQLNGKLYSSEKYGAEFFDYKVFPNKDLPEIESFMLRNASQDFWTSHLRDALASRIISVDNIIDMPFEDFRPAVLYVNGVYEGITHIREDDDKYYAKQNYGQSKGSYQKEQDYSGGIDIRTESGQAEFEQFIDYQQMFFYKSFAAFTAQGESKMMMWRDGVQETQFKVHMHDWDQIFFWAPDYFVYGNNGPMAFTSITMFDEDAKNEMMQMMAAELNLFFDRERLVSIFDSLTTEIRPEIAKHAARNKSMGLTTAFQTKAEWESSLGLIETFIKGRQPLFLEKIKTAYSVSTYDLSHSVNDLKMGHIRVHDFRSDKTSETGAYISGLPIRLLAEAKPGYEFVRWEGDISSTTPEQTMNWSSDKTIKAVFKQSLTPIAEELNLAETQVFYSSNLQQVRVEGHKLQHVELLNVSGKTLKSSSIGNGSSIEWSLSNLAPGKYYLRTRTAHEGSRIKPIEHK